jgi:hypothetical protein
LKRNNTEEVKRGKIGWIMLQHFVVDMLCFDELALLMKNQSLLELFLHRRFHGRPAVRPNAPWQSGSK